ncbi:TonB family protein [Fibrella sp. ES10-3-2-2]|nr:hypothetical protein A6C57_25205 [Fibrella sp. ES10-3-2-2]
MTPLVDYWLKANLFLILFYGCYALLLRRHTFLVLNRTYLMGALLLAFVLPLVHIPGLTFPWPWETDVPAYTAVPLDAILVPGNATAQIETPLLPDWPVLAMWLFALVAAGLLVRTVWRTLSLLRLIQQWPAQLLEDHTLVLPDNEQTPTFSFFHYLVLNPDDARTEAVRQHELVHIRQRHSLDILVLEVVQALCWLNPALFGYRHAIRQVHEYLADRDATPQTPDHRDAYARFLVSYAFHMPTGTPDQHSLAHSFGPDRPDSPTLKQRIQMLYQQHTRRRALWKYALVVPLATALLAMTTKPEPADELPLDVSPTATVHVTGLVRDHLRKPLPGANVVVRNGHQGTTTDIDGRFTIDVPGGTVLVASFVGFQAVELITPSKGNYTAICVLKKQAVNSSAMPQANVPESITLPAPAGSNEVFTVVEEPPTFPGGNNALYAFLGSNLHYPEEARKLGIQGNVFVSFVVDTDGSIDRIRVLKGIGRGCDEEAVRVTSIMPKWTPGKQNGRSVAVQYNLPINFMLGSTSTSNSSTSDRSVTYSAQDSIKVYQNGAVRIYSPAKFPQGGSISSALIFLDDKEITEEEMQRIDPNTIQQVDILKDATTVSIYGEKGRNGVVKITTKKSVSTEKKKDR